MRIFNLDQIRQAINLMDLDDLISCQKNAFINFTIKCYEVPLPMQLNFPASMGDCHIKAGFKKDGEVFVIKIANGFYNNSAYDLPSNDGVMLIFCQKTGLLEAVLHDGGWLTTLRTAIAGLLCASVTPWQIDNIGLIGSGALASLVQLIVKKEYPKANFRIWGRDLKKVQSIATKGSFICESVEKLLEKSDLVISTTAATKAIIKDRDIFGKKHIIALGADDVHKQECDPVLFKRADKVIVDSKLQACNFGDAYHAIKAGFLNLENIVELGEVLHKNLSQNLDLIITDLSGIAAQDMAIAEFVSQKLQDN